MHSALSIVMAGLVPAIHVFQKGKTWMPGTRPGMTEKTYKSNTMRAGSSNPSFTRTKKVTASRPSTIR
jgi:hypothetical protein